MLEFTTVKHSFIVVKMVSGGTCSIPPMAITGALPQMAAPWEACHQTKEGKTDGSDARGGGNRKGQNGDEAEQGGDGSRSGRG